MKSMKPNTQAQLDRINAEIRKKSRRWIYFNSLKNSPSEGWCRERACDRDWELVFPLPCRYQLTPPRNITPTCKESLYYDPQRQISDNRT